ncbi:MAG: acetyltransferase [Cyclobacteriaceae bacterium]|nr:acetyltransferase [Cyclobacteriaceae bacterium]
MIIVGAKGFAKELLEVFFQNNEVNNLFFFDNISVDLPEKLFDRFPVLRSIEEVKDIFQRSGDFSFALGVGSPSIRYALTRYFETVGGVLVSVISPQAAIGHFGNTIGPGCSILGGASITNGVALGKGCLLNPHCSIAHDAELGDFVEMSPGSRVTGSAMVGDFSVLGTNSIVLPKVRIGINVIVGAGAVVTRDVPDNSLVVGVPAKVKRKLEPLNLQ